MTQFSREQCVEAANLLKELFTKTWIKRNPRHPFCQLWMQQGYQPIIELTILGLNLEALRSSPRFNLLIENLKDGSKFYSTEFEAHIGGLFKRSSEVKDFELYPKINNKEPDMRFQVNDKWINIECKTFKCSQKQKEFQELSMKMADTLFQTMSWLASYCAIDIKLKTNLTKDFVDEILYKSKLGIAQFDNNDQIFECSNGYVRVAPVPITAKNFEYKEPRFFHISALADKTENDRMRNTIRDIRRQIPSDCLNIACIGVSGYQNPFNLFGLLVKRELSQKSNRDISAIFLTRRFMAKDKPRQLVDEIYSLRNPKAYQKFNNSLKIKSIGIWVSKITALSEVMLYPRYEYGISEVKGRYIGTGKGEIGFKRSLEKQENRWNGFVIG